MNENYVYLVKTPFGDYGVIERELWKEGDYIVRCFKKITQGNIMLFRSDNLNALSNMLNAANFEYIPFPDFRSAMQYYLEQTK